MPREALYKLRLLILAGGAASPPKVFSPPLEFLSTATSTAVGSKLTEIAMIHGRRFRMSKALNL